MTDDKKFTFLVLCTPIMNACMNAWRPCPFLTKYNKNQNTPRCSIDRSQFPENKNTSSKLHKNGKIKSKNVYPCLVGFNIFKRIIIRKRWFNCILCALNILVVMKCVLKTFKQILCEINRTCLLSYYFFTDFLVTQLRKTNSKNKSTWKVKFCHPVLHNFLLNEIQTY